MKFKTTLIIIFIFLSKHSFSQDYTEYYRWIELSKIQKDVHKKDSLFELAFSKYLGFSEDLVRCMMMRKNLNNKIDSTLLIQLASTHYPWYQLKDDLHLDSKDKRRIKHLYKRLKIKKEQGGSKIFRLIIKDQLCRSNHLKFLTKKNTDSINLRKLQDLYVSKPKLFDRTKTNWITQQMLEILILHQDNWPNVDSFFYQVRTSVKEGKIPPFPMQCMIERRAFFNGTKFELDTISQKLSYQTNFYSNFCNRYYYSCTQSFYGRKVDKINKIYILPPRFPDISLDQHNSLRVFLFLLPIEEAFPPDQFKQLTPEEYCKFNQP